MYVFPYPQDNMDLLHTKKVLVTVVLHRPEASSATETSNIIVILAPPLIVPNAAIQNNPMLI